WQPPAASVAIHGWRTATPVQGVLGRPDWPPEHFLRRRDERLGERHRMLPSTEVHQEESVQPTLLAEIAQHERVLAQHRAVDGSGEHAAIAIGRIVDTSSATRRIHTVTLAEVSYDR